MHQMEFLRELLTILIVSVLVVLGMRRLRVPAVVGFLIAGVLIGPGGLGLVTEHETAEVLAEFGVALVLFMIGLHFSLAEMLRLKHWVFGAGLAQVLLTIALGFGAGLVCRQSPQVSLFAGFLLALSSTAIVLKLQEERGESTTVHGRFSLSLLILQDLAIVPLLLLVPVLTGGGSLTAAFIAAGKSLLLVVLILLASRLVIPRLLEIVVHTRNPESFVLTVIAIAMGTSYLSGLAGLSLALGAFLAGIVISESDYAQHVGAQVLPMRDALGSLFFVSVGMLVQPATWTATWLPLSGMVVGIIVLKAVVVLGVGLIFGLGWRTASQAALSLAQIGELSFVLLAGADLLNEGTRQLVLSASVISMALTPLLMVAGRRLLALKDRPLAGMRHTGLNEEALRDHVVLIGYGLNGRNVGRALTKLGVPYVVLELNPRTARELREQNIPVIYGNGCQESTLRAAGTPQARALVVAIADPVAARCITAAARRLSPSLRLIVRTRFIAEVEMLLGMGADQVVPEEFETSLQLVALTMQAYGAATQEIEAESARLRAEGYALLRATVPVAPPPEDEKKTQRA